MQCAGGVSAKGVSAQGGGCLHRGEVDSLNKPAYHCEVTSENPEYVTYDLLFGSTFELVFQVPIFFFPKNVITGFSQPVYDCT